MCHNSVLRFSSMMRASLVADMPIEHGGLWLFGNAYESGSIVPRVYKNVEVIRRIFQANLSVHLSTRFQPLIEEELAKL